MNWTTLLIILMSSTSSHNIKQTLQNNQLVFNGFNCRVPKKLVSFLTKDWRQPAKAGGENALGEEKAERTVTILQSADFQIVSGKHCTKEVSKFLVYCGSYSHMKFFGPPTVLVSLVISTKECMDMYQRRAYIYKGQTIKIEPNTIVSIPMIVDGSVSHDKNNVYCTGTKFTIEGEQHNNMLSFELWSSYQSK